MDRGKSHQLVVGGMLCLLLVAPCMAQTCGKRQHVTSLIMNGEDAKEGDWPWHAMLFHKTDISLKYKCGGTILDESTVLTTAHCLVTPAGVMNRERILVQVGRNQLLIANNRAQEYDALKLLMHPKFTIHGFSNDIALIKLANEITYTYFIQPICLWNRGPDQNSIVNTTGTVIGFGYSGGYKNILQEVRIPVVSTIECIEDNPTYGTLLTSGMFCAGKRDGDGPCNGDSGGGMFYNYSDVWYIRGLVSFIKPRFGASNPICDPKEYTIFTDVAKYLGWIKQYLGPTSVQQNTSMNYDAKNQTLLSMSTCGTKQCSQGDANCWPWYAAIFRKNYEWFKLDLLCSGTILNEKTILTAVSCYMSHNVNPNKISIQIGRSHFEGYNNWAQKHEVSKIIAHSHYSRNTVSDDIALYVLATKITYTNIIKPICLWNRGESQRAIVNTFASIVRIKYNSTTNILGSLQEKRVPIVSAIDCIESERDIYSKLITSKMLCAGSLGDDLPCFGDAGVGLYFNYDGVWYIRGLVSFRAGSYDDGCNIHSYTVYTDVAQYLDWIEREMRD